MKARASVYLIALIAALAIAVGCTKAPNDAQISSDIQSKFNSDSGLQGKQLNVQAANGAVTLSGNVDNDAEREAAARYASSEPGVKQVVNNLQVGAPPPAADTAQAAVPAEEPKPSPAPKPRRSTHARAHHTAPAESTPTPTESASAAPPAPINLTPSTPPPPPPQKVTIPSGTTLAVRLVDAIDSERSQPGQTFHATLDSPLAVEGDVAVPAGYDVEGHIVDVKSASTDWPANLPALITSTMCPSTS